MEMVVIQECYITRNKYLLKSDNWLEVANCSRNILVSPNQRENYILRVRNTRQIRSTRPANVSSCCPLLVDVLTEPELN